MRLESGIVWDRSNKRVVMKKKEHWVGEVASLTKIMTMIVALEMVEEYGLKVDDDICIASR